MSFKNTLLLIGYLFISSVSIVSAFRVEEALWTILLIVSSAISLALAIVSLVDAKKTTEEIKNLKKNQLGVHVEGETIVYTKGVDN